jgi:hypothetical protein
MTTSLRPDLSPTSCLEVDSAAARELTWLPYAVRFKLDECGLRMSLREWQQLPLGQRADLVHAPLLPGAGGFRPLALAIGAMPDAVGRRDAADVSNSVDLRCLHIGDGQRWLTSATPFARYVAGKLIRKKALDEAA